MDHRIVSIFQPHVRPVVGEKKTADVQFSAKTSISLMDGYAFADKNGWENYSEAGLLQEAMERYKIRYGHYPEAVLVDRLYRNRANLQYCKSLGIRPSETRLGRPPKDALADLYARQINSMRNCIEGKFGKRKPAAGWGVSSHAFQRPASAPFT